MLLVCATVLCACMHVLCACMHACAALQDYLQVHSVGGVSDVEVKERVPSEPDREASWESSDGEVTFLWVMNIPFGSSNAYSSPHAHLSEYAPLSQSPPLCAVICCVRV